jgi:CHAT domain-containing protein
MEIATAEATMLASSDPKTSIQRLDEVAKFFRRRRILYDLASPLARAARLRLQLGDTVAGEANLAEAVSTIEAHAIKSSDPAAARAVALARREVYGQLVAIHLARRDTVGAFVLSERARGNRITRVPRIAPGRTMLALTVLPDETIVWILAGGSLRMTRALASATHLTDLVTRLEDATRRGGESPVFTEVSRALYDLLIAPAEPELKATRELVVVADGVLGRVPFAELKNARGAYLIEEVAVSHAATVREHVAAVVSSPRVLVVGSPAFDVSLFPELQPLDAAIREARQVRLTHRGATLLESAAATKAAVVTAMRSAGVLHFAGHAQLVARAPGLSHLVFARQDGGLGANSLSASEIERMDLRHLQLVLLSACGTTQPRTSRDGSENGLATAFLDAGAGAVVSSLWDADDVGTATLMGELHKRLAAGDSPVMALRAAQLTMIATRSDRASPRLWSAFQIEQK